MNEFADVIEAGTFAGDALMATGTGFGGAGARAIILLGAIGTCFPKLALPKGSTTDPDAATEAELFALFGLVKFFAKGIAVALLPEDAAKDGKLLLDLLIVVLPFVALSTFFAMSVELALFV